MEQQAILSERGRSCELTVNKEDDVKGFVTHYTSLRQVYAQEAAKTAPISVQPFAFHLTASRMYCSRRLSHSTGCERGL